MERLALETAMASPGRPRANRAALETRAGALPRQRLPKAASRRPAALQAKTAMGIGAEGTAVEGAVGVIDGIGRAGTGKAGTAISVRLAGRREKKARASFQRVFPSRWLIRAFRAPTARRWMAP